MTPDTATRKLIYTDVRITGLARGATLRRDLAARTAHHGRGEITLHLPQGWHHESEWMNLFEATCGPPHARVA